MSDSVPPGPDQYNQDGLTTIHSQDFMESPTFQAAYQRGVKAAGTDYGTGGCPSVCGPPSRPPSFRATSWSVASTGVS